MLMRSKTRRSSLVLVSGLALACTPLALAQEYERDNAAFWYQRAFEAFGDISEADYEMVLDYAHDPQGPPPAAVLNATRRGTEALNFLRRASDIAYHELNLDFSQGFDLLLPHLQPMRDLARFAKADAIVRFQSGDVRGATERLSSVYRLAAHAGTDRILISSLVGQAIFDTADNAVLLALDRAALGPGESAELLRALQRFSPDDPFGYVESMMMEQEIAVEWMDKRFGDQDSRQDALKEMAWITNDEEDAVRLAAMTDEEFHADLVAYDDAMNIVVESFMSEDHELARATLKEFEERAASGEFGMLAEILMPSFHRVYEQKLKGHELIDERTAMLEELVTGEVKPEEHANAALYYLRGIKLLGEKLTIESIQRIREHEATPSRAITDELRSDLRASGGAIDIFREGSTKRRCDFSRYRTRGEAALLPHYAAGLREAFRLIEMDALRLLREGELDDAADRLSIAYRMVAHLSTDDPLVVPLIAHAAFRTAQSLTSALTSESGFGDVQQLVLFDAVDAIPLRDPFGYVGSVMATRRAVIGTLRGHSPALREIDRQDMRAIAETWTGDHLMFLLAVIDTLNDASDNADAAWEEELTALAKIISRPDLERARNTVPDVAPLLARGDLDLFAGRTVPLIVGYRAAQRQARSDLRDMLKRLRPTRATSE